MVDQLVTLKIDQVCSYFALTESLNFIRADTAQILVLFLVLSIIPVIAT